MVFIKSISPKPSYIEPPGPLMYMFMAPHQRVRIVNFFNPELSSNYQVLQSMIAIGSGGIFGKGLYMGSQNQENFLPVRDSDFIFAVLGEEFGLIGMLVVIILFTGLLVYPSPSQIYIQDYTYICHRCQY